MQFFNVSGMNNQSGGAEDNGSHHERTDPSIKTQEQGHLLLLYDGMDSGGLQNSCFQFRGMSIPLPGELL